MAQEAISILIAERTREGKFGARLKWAIVRSSTAAARKLFSNEKGYRSKSVPGIPRHGRAAYAVCPVTYPCGDTITLVRGYEGESRRTRIFNGTSRQLMAPWSLRRSAAAARHHDALIGRMGADERCRRLTETLPSRTRGDDDRGLRDACQTNRHGVRRDSRRWPRRLLREIFRVRVRRCSGGGS